MLGFKAIWPLFLGAGLVAGCGGATATAPVRAAASSGTSPSPSLAPAAGGPTTQSSVTLAAAPGFSCADVAAHVDGGTPPQARVLAVATGNHDGAGFERFVLRFDRAPASFRVTRVSNRFTEDGSGRQVAVEGSAGVLVTVTGVGVTTYSGPRSLHPRYPLLRQAELVGAFEGQMQWGLGLSHSACLRVTQPFVTNTLVVDVASPRP